jgi:hypothetical protein
MPALILWMTDKPPTHHGDWIECLSPTPLSKKEVRLWADAVCEESTHRQHLWSRSGGHPGIVSRLLQKQLSTAPMKPDPTEQCLHDCLQVNGPLLLEQLAHHMGLPEHDVLDLVEGMVATGRLIAMEQTLSLPRASA